jgi:hypothetical protein
MKRILLSFIVTLLFFTLHTSAQIKKGAIFLGGNIAASTSKTTSGDQEIGSSNLITLSPVFGKAIKDNLVWGVNSIFSITHYSTNNSYPDKQNENMYGAGIFVRKYKTIGNSGFYFFMQGGAGVNYIKNETIYSIPAETRIQKQYLAYTSCYPGISYTISKKVQLETGFPDLIYLGYAHTTDYITGTTTTRSKSNGFSISSSLSNLSGLSNLYIGFRVLLN